MCLLTFIVTGLKQYGLNAAPKGNILRPVVDHICIIAGGAVNLRDHLAIPFFNYIFAHVAVSLSCYFDFNHPT
jgi:hypothetical protein